jgi:hypothetical protein
MKTISRAVILQNIQNSVPLYLLILIILLIFLDAIVFSKAAYNGTGEIFILYPNDTVVKILDGNWPRISTDKSSIIFSLLFISFISLSFVILFW